MKHFHASNQFNSSEKEEKRTKGFFSFFETFEQDFGKLGVGIAKKLRPFPIDTLANISKNIALTMKSWTDVMFIR